jgi:transcriptional regulator with XRE-family HTH domain
MRFFWTQQPTMSIYMMLVKTSPMLTTGRTISPMPKSTQSPTTEFARRLIAARTARGLTQVQLAELTGSNQRNISHYETGAGYPPVPVIAELANALNVSTDELLGARGIRTPAAKKEQEDPQLKRLWKKFRQVTRLPEKDQRAVIRLINSLAKAS